MDDDCLIVSEDIRSPPMQRCKVNPLRKTKQARLPFIRVPAKSRDATPAESEPRMSATSAGRKVGKKRKHSGSAQCGDGQPKAKKYSTVSTVSRRCASPEVEVSSSSDEVVMVPRESGKGKSPNSSVKSSSSPDERTKSPLSSRTSTFLQNFVKKKPTQQDEVSTSVGVSSDKDASQERPTAPVDGVQDKVMLKESDCGVERDNTLLIKDAGVEDVIESKSHQGESQDPSKIKSQLTKTNSILEAIEIAINNKKPSVKICLDDRDAAEKALADQSRKRKLSCDSGKLPRSEKENIAKPPSPKKSRSLLAAFIQRGIKSSPQSTRGKAGNPSVRNDESLVSSPEISKGDLRDDCNEASLEGSDDILEKLNSKKSSTSSSEDEAKLASEAKTDKTTQGCRERTNSSSDAADDETKGKPRPGDKSPSEAGDESPSEAGDESPSEAGDESPSEAGDESPSEAGDESPSEAGDESPSKAGDKSISEAGDKSISEASDKSPSEAGDKSPSKAGDKSPCEGDAKPRKTPARSSGRSAARRADEDGRSGSSETPKLPCKKLTPKALAKLTEKKQREELRLMKQEEKMKQKQEKEEEKAKKEAVRLKVKEEKKAELDKQRKEKEELRKKKQEEHDAKNKEREEKKKKMEEEKRLKEEEKRAREEEKRKAEQEEDERKKKVAEKFANFFKAGKEEPAAKTVAVKDHSGPFQQMQVSRYTALAPIQRTRLSEESRASLDNHVAPPSNGNSEADVRVPTYLELLRSGDHKPLSSSATPPALVVKDDKDDCVIIERGVDDDDEEEEDDLGYSGEGMVVCEKGAVDPKNHKGKLLKFCENRRPAYWGTWTKKPAAVRPRRPFAKEEIFDYEYDSDDDWEEEEENGESLSDSEGEKEDEEDEQYEVDNDFFVPHGYLSDDEGQEDEEHLDGNVDARHESEHKESTGLVDNKEKLKAKQAEFEKELKKQTKQLKPRVLGCLWLHGDQQSSGAAYEHLHRVMSGYTAVVCLPSPSHPLGPGETEVHASPDPAPAAVSVVAEEKGAAAAVNKSLVDGMRSWYLTFPGIPCAVPPTPQPDLLATPAAVDADTPLASTGANGSQKRKFFKTFPEEAIPALIRLIHGNRNGQLYIVGEFWHYWRKQQQQSEPALERQEAAGTPSTPRPSPKVELSKKKIKDKLYELASYRKCPEDGPFCNQCMWYVDASVREQHGVGDAALPNAWSYCTSVPKASRVREDGNSAGEVPALSKGTNLISKFTKVLSDEEKAVLIANKNADNHGSTSRNEHVDDGDVLEVKSGSGAVCGGGGGGEELQDGKKRCKTVNKAAKSPAKNNPKKVLTPVTKKAAKSSLRLTPKNSPLLAFFKTLRSSESKKSDSKTAGVKNKVTAEDAPPDDQCITID